MRKKQPLKFKISIRVNEDNEYAASVMALPQYKAYVDGAWKDTLKEVYQALSDATARFLALLAHEKAVDLTTNQNSAVKLGGGECSYNLECCDGKG